MTWTAALLLFCACASRAPQPSAQPDSQQAVHAVLLRRCGTCHQGSLPTALPAALAVFDLDLPDWPQRFDAGRFEVALQRLGDDPASDRALFIAFHRSSTPAAPLR